MNNKKWGNRQATLTCVRSTGVKRSAWIGRPRRHRDRLVQLQGVFFLNMPVGGEGRKKPKSEPTFLLLFGLTYK